MLSDPYMHPLYQSIQDGWVPYEDASHLVVGWVPDLHQGGIIGTASDEFTAHRWARIAQQAGFVRVSIMPNDAETYLLVSEDMSTQLSLALGF